MNDNTGEQKPEQAAAAAAPEAEAKAAEEMPSMPSGPNCGNCKFAQIIDPKNLHPTALVLCKRYPPRVSLLAGPQGLQTDAVFPIVQKITHCFEHQPKQLMKLPA